jgi:type IV fimbrial biogenesis protein FimT
MKKAMQTGFTLLELMVTLSIVVVFSMIALPSMSEFIKNEKLTTQINGLVASLQRARSEAIMRHVPITVCSSDNGTGCTNDAWNEGWILFVDVNGDGAVDAEDEILQIRSRLEGNTTLSSSSGATTITYDSRGFTPNVATTFSLCDDRGSSYGKAISISNTGRVSTGGAVSC